MTALAAAGAYRFRVEVANRLLAMVDETVAVTVEGFDLTGAGSARVRGMVIRQPGRQAAVLTIPEARFRFRFDQLAARNIASVELDGPAIDLPASTLQSVGPDNPTGEPSAGETSATRWRIGEVHVRAGSARIRLTDTSELAFRFDLEGGPVAREDEPMPVAGEHVLEVREAAWTNDGRSEPGLRIPRLRARLARPAGSAAEIRSLEVPEMIGDLDLARFFAGTAASAAEGSDRAPPDRAASAGTTEADRRPGTMPGLIIDSMEIGRARLAARGLPDALFPPGAGEPGDRDVVVDAAYRLDDLAISPEGAVTGGVHAIEGSLSVGDWLELPTLAATVETVANRVAIRDFATGAGTLSLGRVPVPGPPPPAGSGSPRSDADAGADPPPVRTRPAIEWARGTIGPLLVSWAGTDDLPGGSATVTTTLADLTLAPGESIPRSDALQAIRVENLSVAFPPGNVARSTGSDALMASGPPAPPLVSVRSIEASLVPDRVIASGRVDSVMVSEPGLFVGADEIRRWAPRLGLAPTAGGERSTQPSSTLPMPGAAAGAVPATVADRPADHPAFGWRSIRVDQLAVTDGRAWSGLVPELGIPSLSAAFDAETTVDPPADGDPAAPSRFHRFRVRNLRASGPGTGGDAEPTSAPPVAIERPIVRLRELTVDVASEAFWSRHEIERVQATGLQFLAGESLRALGRQAASGSAPPPGATPDEPGDAAGSGTTAGGAPAPAAAPESPSSPPADARVASEREPDPEPPRQPWTIGTLQVDESTAIVEELVPGLPPIAFAIDTRLENIPLSRSGLAAAREPQRIEVANAAIRSRLNPLVNVAELRSIFVDFTLGGLLAREIERIEIVSPIIFVGEHLFWYVDYYRKFEAPTSTGTVGETPSAGTGKTATPGNQTENPAGSGWNVRSIEAHNGRLVLAPKGTPLENLPQLPFSGSTRLVDGQLAFDVPEEQLPEAEPAHPILSLTIPRGDYPLRAFSLDWDLNLLGLTGEIAFNLPIGQRTNNLVQILQAEELWFEQVNLSETFLSVTYDQFGIYAQFGGRAFDGYAKGEFNLYLDDRYSWDGWVTGTSIDVDRLTSVLTPSYCRMTGRVNCELIADGDLESLDNLGARGKIRSEPGGGRIDTVALSDLADRLPENLDPLREALLEAGIEVLSHFRFDTAAVDLRASGREGEFDLHLEGPSGVRSVEVRAHDRRYRRPEVAGPPGS